MKKLALLAATIIILSSCSKEVTPKPNDKNTNPTPPVINLTTNIDGIWYDYTHVTSAGYTVPVKFIFSSNTYSYSEYNTTQGWMQFIGNAAVLRIDDELSMPTNPTNYKFFGTVLNDSTINITQYSTPDTLPSYFIHKY